MKNGTMDLIRKVILTIACVVILAACKEDDNGAENIDQLAKDVRGAIQPAKTVDSNIEGYFDMLFYSGAQIFYNVNMAKGERIQNFPDSVANFTFVVSEARKEAGNPLPKNNETMSDLYNKCVKYLQATGKQNLIQK